MNVVIFGLSITSSWGNGHASTYRALARGLHARGHRVVFFERNQEWYSSNRDLPNPEFCELYIYDDWASVLPHARRALRDCDLAMVGSYAPDAMAAIEELFDSAAAVKAFYDIDTPITLADLRERGAAEYLRQEQIAGFDLYLSFTGGPVLRELELKFGARLAAPLYCSFDPAEYRPRARSRRFACDLSYMGTYAADRQPKIEQLFCEPARMLPGAKFLLAGPQYPRKVSWPHNVRRITHLNPRWHPLFYSSSRLTLNVTRRHMVQAGYSPSVRLFEAAASGATLISDNWPGLDTFFTPGQQILLPTSSDDVVRYLTEVDDAELQRIGMAAHERVMAEYTSDHRARELEALVQQVTSTPSLAAAVSS
jgi:spore maturation protein CgeB